MYVHIYIYACINNYAYSMYVCMYVCMYVFMYIYVICIYSTLMYVRMYFNYFRLSKVMLKSLGVISN